MTETTAHAVDPADERRHDPDAARLWNESHYLDFVAADGRLAGYARIGRYPNLGVTWWTATVVGPGRRPVFSVSYDLPLVDGTGLQVAGAGHDVDGVVEAPLDRLRLAGTVPAVCHADAADVYRDAPGEPTALAFDLVWTTDGRPYHYDVTSRYEVPCLVSGTVTVGDETLAVTGQGQRDHSWGERDWWAFGWCWMAGRLEDGTRVHVADIRIPGSPVAFGYVQHAGRVDPVERLVVTEELGVEGMPTAARVEADPGGLILDVTPRAYGPLVLRADDGRVSRFPRAQVDLVAADGRTGSGWIEWNQPGAAGEGR